MSKLLIFIDSLTAGGAERVASRLAYFAIEASNEVVFVTMASRERDFYNLDRRAKRYALGMGSRSFGFGKFFSTIRRIVALRQIIKSEHVDAVVTFMTSSSVIGIFASLGCGVRVAVSERNHPSKKRIAPIWSILRRVVYRFADIHVVQTPSIAAWVRKKTAARRVIIIPNAVSLPIPKVSPEVCPSSVLPDSRRVILAVGTKVEQKGFDLLLDAFALSGNKFDAALVILGLSESSRQSMAEQVCRLGLTESVFLVGKVGNVGDWYARSSLFVLSSRYEGFPNVLLEAMASGCACIAFDCPSGPAEVIKDGVNGLLVPAENIASLSIAIERVLADEQLRLRIAACAVDIVERYSENNIYSKWLAVMKVNL